MCLCDYNTTHSNTVDVNLVLTKLVVSSCEATDNPPLRNERGLVQQRRLVSSSVMMKHSEH